MFLSTTKSILQKRYEMKKITVLLILLTSFFLFAMSDTVKEEEPKADSNKITQQELHQIAINQYMYMLSEEHEWKGMKRNDGEDIIKRILPFKSDSITLAYMVDFNPDGHVLILGYKNLGSLVLQGGCGGHWCTGMKDDYLSITDTRLPIMSRDVYRRIMEDLKSGSLRHFKDEQKKAWEKFNIPIEEFNDRYNYDQQAHPPKWWYEKKKVLNQKNH